jgi:bile acid:Na+ symporter, BASS family
LLVPPVLLLNLFVVVVMFSIGLRVTGGDLAHTLRDRRLVVRSLVANCVIVPALGFLLVTLLPTDPDLKLGFLLLAAIPGTPVALQFTRTATGRLALAASMTFLLTLVSLAITPVVLEVMPQATSHHPKPLLSLVATLVLYLALPLTAGLLVSRRAPGLSPRLVTPLNILATVAFVGLMWETRTFRREAMKSMSRNSLAAILLLILLAMIVGWYLGGPDRESRRVLATSTSMRSVVICFFIARYWFPGTDVYVAPLVYLSLMVPINAVFTLYQKWRQWRLRTVPA